LEPTNQGFAERLRFTSYSLLTGALGYGGNTELNSIGLANQIGKNYAHDNGVEQKAATSDRTFNWNIVAIIRLKDLSDWFDKLPLVKGAFMRLTLNYNSFSAAVTTVKAGLTLNTTSYTQLNGRTCPVMLSSAAALNPLTGFVENSDGTVLTVSCGVVVAPTNSIGKAQINNCRLYVPAYSLNSIYESELISVKPYREVKYLDIYNYNFSKIGAGNTFNQILTNGIVNPKYVVIIPQLNSSASGLTAARSPCQSLTDSSPATTAPLAAIGQFQVQVSGQNMFQQNFQYDFEEFFNEVSAINAINGGLSTGLTSGLLGHYEWDNGYRYYVCDISRRLPIEDSVPKSVVVQGINNTSKDMDYFCFIAFERKVTIDMRTGAIVP
jgi:hypothetical protein